MTRRRVWSERLPESINCFSPVHITDLSHRTSVFTIFDFGEFYHAKNSNFHDNKKRKWYKLMLSFSKWFVPNSGHLNVPNSYDIDSWAFYASSYDMMAKAGNWEVGRKDEIFVILSCCNAKSVLLYEYIRSTTIQFYGSLNHYTYW